MKIDVKTAHFVADFGVVKIYYICEKYAGMNLWDNQILKLFEDKSLVEKIQIKLPKLFQIAELESSRAGKIGMEVGSLRERIVVALLIYVFREENVIGDIPITEAETDVIVFDNPISIKTITGNGGVKLSWTVDAQKAIEFSKNYIPDCDMIFVQINWNNSGGFYYFTKVLQTEIMQNLGREKYLKLPKVGTNPRGTEMSSEALKILMKNENAFKIPINWEKETLDYKPFNRWLELWKE
ncbi:MAG: ThaI family type II restriction endonuclease [Flavobacteriaceae bacterium]|nr:ThaI family type II restriction endonuclease [Flavobacteriaceae bacterium]